MAKEAKTRRTVPQMATEIAALREKYDNVRALNDAAVDSMSQLNTEIHALRERVKSLTAAETALLSEKNDLRRRLEKQQEEIVLLLGHRDAAREFACLATRGHLPAEDQ